VNREAEGKSQTGDVQKLSCIKIGARGEIHRIGIAGAVWQTKAVRSVVHGRRRNKRIVSGYVADVSFAVAVLVYLAGIGYVGAVVVDIVDPVVVVIQITEVPNAVLIIVILGGIGLNRAVVVDIVDPIIVIVRITDITLSIVIQIFLRWIVIIGAVVDGVIVPIPVRITCGNVGKGIAYIPNAVTVGVLLVGIGVTGAVVANIVDTVAVVVGITKVTDTITVEIFLTAIGDQRAIVVTLDHPVLVRVLPP
jgi:hypothetical protein